jgi:hypothetical protein
MKYSRADFLFSQLCDEVDYWKQEAEYWKQKYEKERTEFSKHVDDQIKDANKQIGTLLSFALNITDNADGSLSMSAEKRAELANDLEDKEVSATSWGMDELYPNHEAWED